MDKFLEAYIFPKINQEESENLNRQITPSEIEAVLKKTPNKCPWPEGFAGEFYQTFQEELTSFFLNYSKKFDRRENFQARVTRPALS